MNKQMNKQMKKQMTDKQLRVRTLVHAGDPFAVCKTMPSGEDKCDCEFEVRAALGERGSSNWDEYMKCVRSIR